MVSEVRTHMHMRGRVQCIELAVEVQVLLDELLACLLFPQVVLERLDFASVVRLPLDEVDHVLDIRLFTRVVSQCEVGTFECWFKRIS